MPSANRGAKTGNPRSTKVDTPKPQGHVSNPRGSEPDHEGATDRQVGDRGGPGPGYDDEPEKVKDEGGVV
jgi:hypothetical protein